MKNRNETRISSCLNRDIVSPPYESSIEGPRKVETDS
jgi:hypothetical protein